MSEPEEAEEEPVSYNFIFKKSTNPYLSQKTTNLFGLINSYSGIPDFNIFYKIITSKIFFIRGVYYFIRISHSSL